MKYAEITEKHIFNINSILNFVEALSNKTIDKEYHKVDKMTSVLENCLKILRSINTLDLDKEFMISVEDFDKIILHVHIFRVKFEQLLDWDCEFNYDETYSQQEIYETLTYYHEHITQLTSEQGNKIAGLYIAIVNTLIIIKEEVENLIVKWEKMGAPFANVQTINAPALSVIENNPTQNGNTITANSSKFKLVKNKKIDFIKILSAMYDNQMFETEDGYLATNKQELFNEFGKLLNADFRNYSTNLSQSKLTVKDSFLKPFKDIEHKAEAYYDK